MLFGGIFIENYLINPHFRQSWKYPATHQKIQSIWKINIYRLHISLCKIYIYGKKRINLSFTLLLSNTIVYNEFPIPFVLLHFCVWYSRLINENDMEFILYFIWKKKIKRTENEIKTKTRTKNDESHTAHIQ